MAGLGETAAFLKTVRKYAQASGGPGGHTRCREVTDFGPNPGQLRMLAYAPAALPAGAPLVVTLHGCTQFGEAYAAGAGWLDLADRFGFAVLAPEQLQGNNPSRCFNWFSPQDVRRGEGEARSIASMIGAMIAQHGLDADRVFITGLSAGGAMTAAMLAAYPELFAGGAIIAGLPYGVASSLPEALKAMQGGDGRSSAALSDLVRKAAPGARPPLKLSIWHGEADHTVHPSNGQDLARQWTAALGLKGAGDAARHDLYTRRTWEGRSVVELVTIPGLGHGTPLSALGPDGLGAAAPFMIEAGLCSTREIAAFWGLTGAASYAPQPKIRAQLHRAAHTPPQHGDMHGVTSRVQDVISKALRSAGLMK